MGSPTQPESTRTQAEVTCSGAPHSHPHLDLAASALLLCPRAASPVLSLRDEATAQRHREARLVRSHRSATDDAAVPPGRVFRGAPAHHEGFAAPRRGLAGWAPVSTPRLLSVARDAARVGQPRAAAGAPRRERCQGGLDPAKAAATWPQGPCARCRRCDDPWSCSIARSCAAAELAPPRPRAVDAPVRRARTSRSTRQAVSFGRPRLVPARIVASARHTTYGIVGPHQVLLLHPVPVLQILRPSGEYIAMTPKL